MSDDESRADTNEARKAMEEATRRKQERMAEEMAEYEEARRAERGKELEELENLRIKREQRKLDRQKEDGRLAEMREQEDKRQRAEQEERKRKKLEEEQKRKEEREKKRKEAEARSAFTKTDGDGASRNFVINKREGGEAFDHMGDEPQQKSKEQLEEEKRTALAQRIQVLNIENFNQEKLIEKARQLHDKLMALEADKYDLEQRFKRQQYDMIELAERSRQMNKGKNKRSAVQVDESFDRLSDKYTSAPPKIQMYSKYERLTDRRTFGERTDLFVELCKEVPPPEITRINPVNTAEEEVEESAE